MPPLSVVSDSNASSFNLHPIEFEDFYDDESDESGFEFFNEGEAPVRDVDNPTWREALSGDDATEWQRGLGKEIAGLKRKGIAISVPRSSVPSSAKILRTLILAKLKRDEAGRITRRKVRLAVQDSGQREGLDYHEISASVIRSSSFRMVLSIAAEQNMKVRQVDIEQAFAHVNLKEDIYIYAPAGAEEPGMVWKLVKALYGLKQAPREFGEFLSEAIISNGFVPCRHDPCVYWKRDAEGRLTLLLLISWILKLSSIDFCYTPMIICGIWTSLLAVFQPMLQRLGLFRLLIHQYHLCVRRRLLLLLSLYYLMQCYWLLPLLLLMKF